MPGIRRIDDCLTSRDGVLHVEECSAVDLVEQFGSPLFVLSEAQLRGNVRRFQRAFSERWTDGPVDVLPAFKANWTIASRRVLTEEGAGADVYSEGELHGVLTAGVDPERISVNGGGKSEALVRKCVRAGVRITIEDLDEPELVDRVAREEGRIAKVRLRVKPRFPSLWRMTDFSHELVSIDLGHQAYKSGIPEEYVPDLGRKVLALSNLDLVGLHLHVGRHHPSTWFWRGAMREYARMIVALSRAWGGWRPKEIDVGGGFATPRDPHNKIGVRSEVLLTVLAYPFEQILRLLGSALRYRVLSAVITRLFARLPTSARAPSVEQYAEAVVSSLRPVLSRHFGDLAGIRLQVEPGRCLYGDAGIHLARVKKVKRQTKPVALSWILTDTTYFFLSGGVLESNVHDFRVANKTDDPPVEVADVVGHSCYADRILPFVRVPRVEPGDLIAFLDTGAYQEVSASNFNALPRPPVVLVSGDHADVIRRGETLEDVYRRDFIPERLREQVAAERPAAPVEEHPLALS